MVLLGLGWERGAGAALGHAFALVDGGRGAELLRRWRPWAVRRLRRAWLAFAVIQTLLLAQFLAASPVGLPNHKASHQNRFPAQHLAQQIAPPPGGALGGPIDILVGRNFWRATSRAFARAAARAGGWPPALQPVDSGRRTGHGARAGSGTLPPPEQRSPAAGRCTSTGPGAPGKRLRRIRRWLLRCLRGRTSGGTQARQCTGELALLGVARPGHAELPGVRGERRRLASPGGLGGVQPGGQRRGSSVHSHSAPCCCSRCGVAQGKSVDRHPAAPRRFIVRHQRRRSPQPVIASDGVEAAGGTLRHAARACSASAAWPVSVRAGRWRSCAPPAQKAPGQQGRSPPATPTARAPAWVAVMTSQLRGDHSATSSPLNAPWACPMSYRRAPVSTPSSVTSSPGPRARHNRWEFSGVRHALGSAAPRFQVAPLAQGRPPPRSAAAAGGSAPGCQEIPELASGASAWPGLSVGWHIPWAASGFPIAITDGGKNAGGYENASQNFKIKYFAA